MSYADITTYLYDVIRYGYMELIEREQLNEYGFIPTCRSECPISHKAGSKRVDIAYITYENDKYMVNCVEIKSGKTDLNTGLGRNFVGNYNWLVVMKDIEDFALEFINNNYPFVGLIVIDGIIGDFFVDETISNTFSWEIIKEPIKCKSNKYTNNIEGYLCGKKRDYISLYDKTEFDLICDNNNSDGEDEYESYIKFKSLQFPQILSVLENKYSEILSQGIG